MMKQGHRGKWIWEEEHIVFLKDNFDKLTNRELADALGCGLTATRTKLYQLGMKRMELQYWTEEQVDFLLANYKKKGDTELAIIFNKKWHKEKGWTKKHIEKKRMYLKLKRTELEKKLIKKRNTEMGMFAECAKKRWETIGVAPEGEIRIWKNSYKTNEVAVIKTKKGWVHYNRWLYESNFIKLKSDELVVTKSGKTIAEGPYDLEIINRQEHARRNSLKRYPEELRESVGLIRELQKEINSNN